MVGGFEIDTPCHPGMTDGTKPSAWRMGDPLEDTAGADQGAGGGRSAQSWRKSGRHAWPT